MIQMKFKTKYLCFINIFHHTTDTAELPISIHLMMTFSHMKYYKACKKCAYNADITYEEKQSAVFFYFAITLKISVPLSASTMIWFYFDRFGIVFSLEYRLRFMSISVYAIIIMKYNGSSRELSPFMLGGTSN